MSSTDSWTSSLRPVRFLCALLGAVLLWTASPGDGRSQGFGVYEQGTCVMGRAGAAVAQGCGDGSSVFFNPAHLAGTQGLTLTAGATAIAAGGDFTYDAPSDAPAGQREVELQNDPIPVPHLFATYGLTDRMGVGLGVFVPYGLETVWPRRVGGEVFDGAFEGYENRVQSIYIQPTVAYQVTPKLSVGAGPIVSVSSVELNQFQDLSQQAVRDPQTGEPVPDPVNPEQNLRFSRLGIPYHTAFADVSLEGSNALGFGAQFGATYDATERLTVGARFMTPITVSFDDGEASFDRVDTGLILPPNNPVAPNTALPVDQLLAPQFQGDGLLTDQRVETEITFPFQLVVGGSFQATPKLLLLADYQLNGWSSFDEIPLEFEKLGDRSRREGYENTHAFRFAGEYDVLPSLTARAGYLYNTAAAPDDVVTPLLPESDRHQFTVGFGYRLIDALELNVSYQRLTQNDRRGRVRGAQPGEEPTTALNQGLYSFGANLFAATVTVRL